MKKKKREKIWKKINKDLFQKGDLDNDGIIRDRGTVMECRLTLNFLKKGIIECVKTLDMPDCFGLNKNIERNWNKDFKFVNRQICSYNYNLSFQRQTDFNILKVFL